MNYNVDEKEILKELRNLKEVIGSFEKLVSVSNPRDDIKDLQLVSFWVDSSLNASFQTAIQNN